MTDDLPRPGSYDAQALGCKCPVLDNHYGRGYWGDGKKYGWVHREDCPIHGEPSSEQINNPDPSYEGESRP